MKKIIEYGAVVHYDMNEFTKIIAELIEKGYQPFGSLGNTVDMNGDSLFTQAIVKYEEVAE